MSSEKSVELKEATISGESYYQITNSDQMRPFLMTLVNPYDHWMFISSNGGLSAGRKNADYALFPYYTDDKLTELADTTGSKSIFRITSGERKVLWEPFSYRYDGIHAISRNLYKSTYGNQVILEEINHTLNLSFRYKWSTSKEYGFIRSATVSNHNDQDVEMDILDGIQNIMPYGVPSDLQNSLSNLVDAYKRSELDTSTGIGIYALSAIIVDRAEPSEALKANIVWSLGLDKPTHLLSSKQLALFRSGGTLSPEQDVKAEKGAYFLNSNIVVKSNTSNEWHIITDANQSQSSIARLQKNITHGTITKDHLTTSINRGTQELIQLNAGADGIQLTADSKEDARHFSNVLFNNMRGGIFDNNYNIQKSDFISYLKKSNRQAYKIHLDTLEKLPDTFDLHLLDQAFKTINDPALQRLSKEYLPLKFSRRHGDPSRPWNKFSINIQDERGNKVLDYQGNWRDIFQNWEALAHSYPLFIESMIHRFLNASTFDGYNPYRVLKYGFDWEVIEPHDPWSYIGYWGDHQIIYLLKLLELCEKIQPGKLADQLDKEIFVYANVPYKIKSYQEILSNPKDTITFDANLDKEIGKLREKEGVDGALLKNQSGDIHTVNFLEKILATTLAKVSNFIPGAGLWLNTQRPEWNDANNALVGNGVSMVTTYYLRRFLSFFANLLDDVGDRNINISEEVHDLFHAISQALMDKKEVLSSGITDAIRKEIVDSLSQPASDFRRDIYEQAFAGSQKEIALSQIRSWISICLKYIDHTIKSNLRPDGLYHAYNLMFSDAQGVSIDYLYEMLEGQVSALSSGHMSAEEAVSVLDNLRSSNMYREDQNSYILYPNKKLPGFLYKNVISSSAVENSSLLSILIEDDDHKIISKDVFGKYHFHGDFRNASHLDAALNLLPEKYQPLVEKDRDNILAIYEEVFNHKTFTGRSGTFYGYEGLGSIYWHMVSKLRLAVLECCQKAIDEKATQDITDRLIKRYYDIVAGLGVHKTPEVYGAYTTDAYSHTPGGKGAQQPGMTGQVKEDIIARYGELGVILENGCIQFKPQILRKSEFISTPSTFDYYDVQGKDSQINIPAGSLAYTFCQVPIVYRIGKERNTILRLADDREHHIEGCTLDRRSSHDVFSRTGKIKAIVVDVKASKLIQH